MRQVFDLGLAVQLAPGAATKMTAARASRSPARRLPSSCGRITSVGDTTRLNSTSQLV